MHRRSSLPFCLLALILTTSCTSAPKYAATPFIPQAVSSSPTPFQPGGDGLVFDPSELRTAAPTFTPYPFVAPRNDPISIPQVATPADGEDIPQLEIDPFTGLPPSDPALLDRRPLAIKISQEPRSIRPQFGLNEADVVFEYYTEWFYTRFIAIFYGNNATKIGPVRSGRYFDEHITRMYHAYYAFNFADQTHEWPYYLRSDLAQFLLTPGDNCSYPPYFTSRTSSLISDISHYECYFNSTRLNDYLARKGNDNARQNVRGGFFSPQIPADGFAVDRIFTHYSHCDYNYWEYDPDSARYLRYQETSPNLKGSHIDTDCSDKPEIYVPLTDALTGKQVAADNVAVLFVSYTFSNESEQRNEIYHINLVDSGNAFVFRNGLAYPARWMRTDIDQPLLITTPDGSPVYFKPGNTFYQVIGVTSGDWSDGTDWHFDFHTP